MDKKGVLYIVATPVGNLEDVTARAARVLSEVDLVAAEDTRRANKLLSSLGLKKPRISHFMHNQKKSAMEIISRLEKGLDVALVSDAGTPGLSDPGAMLVGMARSAGFKVVPVPGPSALAAAASVSDITCDRFTFAGFLPAGKNDRQKRLAEISDRNETLVFYEAPHRLIKTLGDIREILGNRRALIARELTKIHEEIISASIEELLDIFGQREVKGEITLIVEGQTRNSAAPDEKEIEKILEKKILKDNKSVRETVEELKAALPFSKREIYRKALEIKKRGQTKKSK